MEFWNSEILESEKEIIPYYSKRRMGILRGPHKAGPQCLRALWARTARKAGPQGLRALWPRPRLMDQEGIMKGSRWIRSVFL